ncbi:MAG TPA: glycosyltransferase family 4 protein [Pseudomonadales bacterium]|nr:glycosyltransferase family 4 protein [Pseudomonadales bacterium]
MNLAFALYKYFPYGGLQRDMLRIAQACVARGSVVTIYCADWQGDLPADIRVEPIAVRGASNHSRNRHFSAALQSRLKQEAHDLVVGFNKMAGLDIYYAADTCFKAKVMQERLPALRFLPRYRQYLKDEAEVFGAVSNTKILAIAERSIDEYEQYYSGVKKRCTVLPPGINPDRRAGDNAAEIRSKFRSEWSLQEKDKLLLMVGSGFRTKGLDRTIRALAALPPDVLVNTRLVVIGQDKPDAFIKLAKTLHVEQRLEFLAGRDDIPAFLQGAELLIHPAYRENTGTVLLEAAVAGLPVLTTAVCGYSGYIRDYDCGIVVDEPFDQQELNNALSVMLGDDARRKAWRENALKMAEIADIYSLFDRAADFIVAAAKSRIA